MSDVLILAIALFLVFALLALGLARMADDREDG